MLYLIATPIGNLSDITYRAIETLQDCDYILCEDTRHSLPLLLHYQIQKPLHSFHKFNEKSSEEKIIQDLINGKSVGVISDAGTPGIADPGASLVRRCREEGIQVSSIPGACAAITAITCSGLDTSTFQFVGFLPKKAGELKDALIGILHYPGTTICYESPNRLQDLLQTIGTIAPERTLVIARELTKKFEEVCSGNALELLKQWKDRVVKGEIVLLIDGDKAAMQDSWKLISPEEHVRLIEETYHVSNFEAIKIVANMRGVPKRDIYNKFHI